MPSTPIPKPRGSGRAGAVRSRLLEVPPRLARARVSVRGARAARPRRGPPRAARPPRRAPTGRASPRAPRRHGRRGRARRGGAARRRRLVPRQPARGAEPGVQDEGRDGEDRRQHAGRARALMRSATRGRGPPRARGAGAGAREAGTFDGEPSTLSMKRAPSRPRGSPALSSGSPVAAYQASSPGLIGARRTTLRSTPRRPSPGHDADPVTTSCVRPASRPSIATAFALVAGLPRMCPSQRTSVSAATTGRASPRATPAPWPGQALDRGGPVLARAQRLVLVRHDHAEGTPSSRRIRARRGRRRRGRGGAPRGGQGAGRG